MPSGPGTYTTPCCTGRAWATRGSASSATVPTAAGTAGTAGQAAAGSGPSGRGCASGCTRTAYCSWCCTARTQPCSVSQRRGIGSAVPTPRVAAVQCLRRPAVTRVGLQLRELKASIKTKTLKKNCKSFKFFLKEVFFLKYFFKNNFLKKFFFFKYFFKNNFLKISFLNEIFFFQKKKLFDSVFVTGQSRKRKDNRRGRDGADASPDGSLVARCGGSRLHPARPFFERRTVGRVRYCRVAVTAGLACLR